MKWVFGGGKEVGGGAVGGRGVCLAFLGCVYLKKSFS